MSERMLQVNALLQEKLAHIFSQKIEVPFDFFVTVTKVDCAPDLKAAKVFLSILPFAQAKSGMAWVVNNRKEIQRQLSKSVNLKFTPVLKFLHDTAEENAEEIYNIIDNL